MNKTTIIIIVIAIAALGGIIWMANLQKVDTASLSSNSNGILKAEEIDFDFGSISMAAGNVTHQFKIKNEGNEPVTIGKMYTSCMCTTASLLIGDKKIGPVGMPGHGAIPKLNQIINSNEEAAVEVVFDPTAHGPAGVGRIQRVVTLENNAGQPLELRFAAIVTP